MNGNKSGLHVFGFIKWLQGIDTLLMLISGYQGNCRDKGS